MVRRTWTQDALQWNIHPVSGSADTLAAEWHVPPLIAGVLHNRQVVSIDQAEVFLNPSLSRDLRDPEELTGCVAAANRIAEAISKEQKIVIYGDYDVDGITASSILLSCIKLCGGKTGFYVPHRLDEGYGLNREALEQIVDEGGDLVVTVDCGISSGDLIDQFRDRLDMIITDHHVLPARLPDVEAIVHPHVDGYCNPHLCGAGVAFKLAWQVARQICGNHRVNDQMREFLMEALTLAGLGTIADFVPLIGENHTIAHYGLLGIPAVNLLGIKALLESSNLATKKTIDAHHVGFVLAPRLNAAGRMGHAREAVELLTTDDPAVAKKIATELGVENNRRREVEQTITAQAVELIEEQSLDILNNRAIVLASEKWHGGVIGIVASRIVSRFNRPAVIMDIGQDGTTQGSARSVPGFHMAEALAACSEHLVSHGGHAMAGGLRIETSAIEAFTSQFVEYANQQLQDHTFRPSIDVEAEATIADFTMKTIQFLEKLAPFGSQNPKPLFVLRGCKLAGRPRRMGARGDTIDVKLKQGQNMLRGVGFRMAELPDYLADVSTVDVVVRPYINEFRGRRTVELELHDVRKSAHSAGV